MLKITEIELELFTDINMVIFVETGIRESISQWSNRYGKANNPYMGKQYYPNETSFLKYYDLNNMFGITCSVKPWQYHCPYSVIIDDIKDFDEFSYIFKVGLHYSRELFETRKEIPLCPEYKEPPASRNKNRKLLTTLFDKKEYVFHYKIVRLAQQLGLKITEVRKVLKFKQTRWLKKYTDLNTECRIKSKNKWWFL